MSTYKDAGVDIDAGDRAVELMKASIAKASRPEVMGGIGGFAGLFDASKLKEMKQPLLATSTDGVVFTECPGNFGLCSNTICRCCKQWLFHFFQLACIK